MAQRVLFPEIVRVEARAARIDDVFFAFLGLDEVSRHIAARTEEIDLEYECVMRQPGVEHVYERGIRDEAAVPVKLSLDFDWRKGWWQRRACHHMGGGDLALRVVEINEVAQTNVDGAER